MGIRGSSRSVLVFMTIGFTTVPASMRTVGATKIDSDATIDIQYDEQGSVFDDEIVT